MRIFVIIYLPLHINRIGEPRIEPRLNSCISLSIICDSSIQIDQIMPILYSIHVKCPIILGCDCPKISFIFLKKPCSIISAKVYETFRKSVLQLGLSILFCICSIKIPDVNASLLLMYITHGLHRLNHIHVAFFSGVLWARQTKSE
jgi:hypothetical protein